MRMRKLKIGLLIAAWVVIGITGVVYSWTCCWGLDLTGFELIMLGILGAILGPFSWSLPVMNKISDWDWLDTVIIEADTTRR